MGEAVDIRVAGHRQVLNEVLALHSMGLSEISQEEWKWKHLDNPFIEGEPEVIVAVDGNTIVGANCFMPLRFIVGGKQVKALQSSDTIVHPAYRGRGIFSRLLAFGESRYQQNGYQFAFGFPNENSLAGFLKRGWKPVMPIRRLNYFINWRRVVQSLMPSLPLQGVASWACDKFLVRRTRKDLPARKTGFTVFDRFPDAMNRLDGLYNEHALELIRSREYMEWRLGRHPGSSFHYIIAADQQGLLWYVVVDVIEDHRGLRSGRIADYKVRNESTRLFEDALSASIEFLRGKKCDRIMMFRPTPLGFGDVSGKLGFATTLESLAHRVKKWSGKPDPCLVVKPLQVGDSSVNFLDPSRWAPTLLYHDVL